MMDFDHAIEVADETLDGGYNSQTARALILVADNDYWGLREVYAF